MSFYTGRVSLCPLPSGDWHLDSDLIWEIGRKGSGYRYMVPAGYTSDLASIPWLARLVFDRGDSRLAKAAILHDHMLNAGWSRITAAAEFHEALKADGVSRWQRCVMYLAVSLWCYD